MSTDPDPRTRGLDIPLRPVRSATICATAPTYPGGDEAPGQPEAAADRPDQARADAGSSPAADIDSTNPYRANRAAEAPGQGSTRERRDAMSTSLPYAVAEAMSDRALADNVTLGEVLMAAVRRQGLWLPPKAGRGALRQADILG